MRDKIKILEVHPVLSVREGGRCESALASAGRITLGTHGPACSVFKDKWLEYLIY